MNDPQDALLPTEKDNVFLCAPRSVDPLAFSCIFGANLLDWYSVTSLLFDGCFRAYDPTVYEDSLPSPTEGPLRDLPCVSRLFPS